MKKKIDSKIIIPFVIIVVLFVSIIVYVCTKDNGYNKYKEVKSENLVYTIYESGDTFVPNINLNNDLSKNINKVIIDKANAFLALDDNNVITYTYDLNGKILSVAIQYISIVEKEPIITYDVYNIHIANDKLLDENEVLDLYSITKEQVVGVVEGKFKDFYRDLFNQKYFDEECDYDCFLFMRGIENENYLDNSHYYIKQGNLYVIRPFKIYSVFNEEKFFSSSDFLIQITE